MSKPNSQCRLPIRAFIPIYCYGIVLNSYLLGMDTYAASMRARARQIPC